LGIVDHPLVSFIKQVPTKQLEEAQNTMGFEFKVPLIEVFAYTVQVVAWARLTMLDDAGDGFSCSDYWLHNIMGMDAILETWRAEVILGYAGGQSKLDVLSTRLDADKESDEYKQAEKVVFSMLGESCMQKISRGKSLLVATQLGALLDLPENADKDHEAGTFAELFRYGTLHFRQKRQHIEERAPEVKSTPIKKGHLEPF
jgi:hypothetical protein